MAAGNMNGALAPLQVVALIPVFYLGANQKAGHKNVLLAGGYI